MKNNKLINKIKDSRQRRKKALETARKKPNRKKACEVWKQVVSLKTNNKKKRSKRKSFGFSKNADSETASCSRLSHKHSQNKI